MLSKALEKSNRTSKETIFSSMAMSRLFVIFKRAVVVLWLDLKPDKSRFITSFYSMYVVICLRQAGFWESRRIVIFGISFDNFHVIGKLEAVRMELKMWVTYGSMFVKIILENLIGTPSEPIALDLKTSSLNVPAKANSTFWGLRPGSTLLSLGLVTVGVSKKVFSWSGVNIILSSTVSRCQNSSKTFLVAGQG
jgi:hypothetical protein